MVAAHQQKSETDARRLETARRAWLKILEAARRLRPLTEALSGEPRKDLYVLVQDSAMDSWALLRDFYVDGEKEGHGAPLRDVPEVDGQLLGAMSELLAIAGVASLASRSEPKNLWEVRPNDFGSAVDALVRQLEDRIGGTWCDADESLPVLWASKGASSGEQGS